MCEAGTLRLNKGIVALETQQSSAARLIGCTTIIERMIKDTSVSCILNKVFDATTVLFHDPSCTLPKKMSQVAKSSSFVKPPLSPHFAVYRLDVDGTMPFTQQAPYTNVTVLDGTVPLRQMAKIIQLKPAIVSSSPIKLKPGSLPVNLPSSPQRQVPMRNS